VVPEDAGLTAIVKVHWILAKAAVTVALLERVAVVDALDVSATAAPLVAVQFAKRQLAPAAAVIF
jgi:hypothetical protein